MSSLSLVSWERVRAERGEEEGVSGEVGVLHLERLASDILQSWLDEPRVVPASDHHHTDSATAQPASQAE